LGFPGRMSQLAIAPDDDWSPKTVRPLGGGPPMDSVYWAMSKAGITMVRANAMDFRANSGARDISGANPLGWEHRQCKIRNTIDGKEITLLTHSGYPIIGSKAWYSVFNDSAAPFDSACKIGQVSKEFNRDWMAFTQDRDGL